MSLCGLKEQHVLVGLAEQRLVLHLRVQPIIKARLHSLGASLSLALQELLGQPELVVPLLELGDEGVHVG